MALLEIRSSVAMRNIRSPVLRKFECEQLDSYDFILLFEHKLELSWVEAQTGNLSASS